MSGFINIPALAEDTAWLFNGSIARIQTISRQMRMIAGPREEVYSHERISDCNRLLKALKRQLNVEMTFFHEEVRNTFDWHRHLKTYRKIFVHHLLGRKNTCVSSLNNMV